MDTYSNSATRQLLNIGGGTTRWIKAAVAALLDDLSGAAREASGWPTAAIVDGDHIEIFDRNKAGGFDLALTLGATASEIRSGLQGQRRGGGRKDTLLRIGSGRAVIKRLQLPAAAIEVLPAIIRNKVESLAPWPLAEAMWGYRIAGPAQSGLLDVEVGIVSRKLVEGLMTALGEGGVKVTHLDIGDGTVEKSGIAIDFLGADRSQKMRRRFASLMTLAAVFSAGVAGYGLYLVFTAQAGLWDVEQRSTALKTALVRGNSSAEAGTRLSEANRIFARKKDMPPFVVLLNTLTELVPDGTWLDGIVYNGARLTINGKGVEITKVIASLEKSNYFADVNFAAATQRDADLNIDSFSISALVENGKVLP